MARNNSVNNRFGAYLTPLFTWPLAKLGLSIPMHEKNHGRFEARLIRALAPKLAAVMTSYGHDFSGPIPLKRLVKDQLTLLRPTWARRVSFAAQARLKKSPRPAWHEYAVRSIAPRLSRMERYFDVDAIHHSGQLNRLYTLELLAQELDLSWALRAHASRASKASVVVDHAPPPPPEPEVAGAVGVVGVVGVVGGGGVPGVGAFTVTTTLANAAAPPELEQDSSNVEFEVKAILVSVPELALFPAHALLATQPWAFVELQVNVVVLPLFTVVGDADSAAVGVGEEGGGGGGGDVPLTVFFVSDNAQPVLVPDPT
jgi:hypothetical protein